MSQPVKIQINSLEALERLIGGDSQLEIEIRNSIVQEFTRKHLKAIVSSADFSQAQQSIQQSIIKEFSSGIATLTKDLLGNVYKCELHQIVKDRIKKEALLAVGDAVIEAFNKIDLDKEISKRVDFWTNERVKEIVQDKVKKVLGQNI